MPFYESLYSLGCMKSCVPLLISALLFFSTAAHSLAQHRLTTRALKMMTYNWEVGGMAGQSTYFGDLAPGSGRLSTTFNGATPYLGIIVAKRIMPNVTFRGQLGWVRLEGDDNSNKQVSLSSATRYVRNLHFRNDIIEAQGNVVFDLLPTKIYLKRPIINPYGFIGLSIFTNNPKARGPQGTPQQNEWVALRPLKTNGVGYSRIQTGVPLGIGIKYKLTYEVNIGIELGFRLTFTNYLDDVGGGPYPLLSEFDSDLAALMSHRSGETINTRTGEPREIARIYSEVSPITPEKGGKLPSGATLTVIQGHRNDGAGGGSPRGGEGADFYLVSGVHATYILHGKRLKHERKKQNHNKKF